MCLFMTWIKYGKPDISMAMNGGLAGLVGITAGCHLIMLPIEACLIGCVAAVLVFISVPLMDRYKLDDPVGAVAVHGVGGIWGVLAVGLFANPSLLASSSGELAMAGLFHGGGIKLLAIQFTGVVSMIFCVGGMSWLAFKMIRCFLG